MQQFSQKGHGAGSQIDPTPNGLEIDVKDIQNMPAF